MCACPRPWRAHRPCIYSIVGVLPRRLLRTRHLVNTLCVPSCFPVPSVPVFPQTPRVSTQFPSMPVSTRRTPARDEPPRSSAAHHSTESSRGPAAAPHGTFPGLPELARDSLLSDGAWNSPRHEREVCPCLLFSSTRTKGSAQKRYV